MAVHHPGMKQEVGDLMHTIRQMVTQAMQNASFGSAGLRVYGGGWITIENGGLAVTGSAIISGNLDVTGTANVTGTLKGDGRLDWTGPWFLKGKGQISGDTTGTGRLDWSGPWALKGRGDISGNVDISGALDVKNRLTLGPNGYIEAGSVRIDRGGSYGGRIQSTGPVLALGASGSVQILADQFNAKDGFYTGGLTVMGNMDSLGTVSSNIKNFKIPHPVKETYVLRHGSTESPVSGVEYWGEETLDSDGNGVVELPDYFESLTKNENRSVLVTPRGFLADWGDIEDGRFSVTGKPGGRFAWLVKAERVGADFPVEEALPSNRPGE